jgi:hypothetical protein
LALPILLRLRIELPKDPAQRTQEEEELWMSTQDIVKQLFEDGRKEGLKEGLKEGREEGLVEAILTLYDMRFGRPPADIEAVLCRTHDRAILREWLKLVGTRSADEVAAALREGKTS